MEGIQYEIGYIFLNKATMQLCIQEIGKEADDVAYLHTIKPYETIEVYRNEQWEEITGINSSLAPTEYDDRIIGLKARFKR